MKGTKKNVIAIYIASLFSYQMYIAPLLLASLYGAFPDVDPNAVMLMYTAPTLVSALAAFVLGPMMSRVSKKLIVSVGLAAIALGGVLILTVGGSAFYAALAGAILTGVGYACIINSTNTMLAEVDPMNAGKNIATNSAVGCLGSMVITSLAGVLASSGDWTRAYLLCLPAAVCLVLFLILYKEEKVVPAEAQAAAAEAAAPANKNFGLFLPVIFIFFMSNIGTSAWNANNAVYVMMEKQIGTTVETGMMSTLSSLGGVIGGFVLAGIIIPKLKSFTVPVCLLIVTAPLVAAALGTTSIPLLYVCSVIFMMFFQPVYGCISAAAGKLMPGGVGVAGVNACMGLGGFIAPYIVNFIGTFGDGTTTIKFVAGIVAFVIAAAIALPIMKKADAWQG